MDQNYRFMVQSNQFTGECVPCTLDVFNQYVDSQDVSFKISIRRAVEAAISQALPLDEYLNNPRFLNFCQKQKGAKFQELTQTEKLLQWVANQKMWLPCFIFAVREFGLVPKTDKEGNAVLDEQGNPVMYHRRKQPNIQELSGLFMFDADHLPISPREVFERTQVADFPWKVLLAHETSSGEGLRLVSEIRPELGNIADNQICLARELGLMGLKGTTGKPVVDDSCIDASRISYCPRREDIYYINEVELLNNINHE